MISPNRVVQFIAERLGVDAQVLSDDVGVGDLPEWDSLAQVALIAAAEQEFSTTIDIDVAFGLETVGDFVAFLTSLE